MNITPKKGLLFLFACGLTFVFQTHFANAQQKDKLQEVLDRGHLILGTGSTNPPWHFIDEAGKLSGFDVDMGKLVAKGLFGDAESIEFVQQSGDARIPNLITDKVDISCQFMTVTSERAQQVEFTVPYYREGVGLMMLEKSDFQNHQALKEAGSDITIAVLQNVYAEEMVGVALPEAKVDQYDSVDLIYQALNSKRADAVATDQSAVRWIMVQTPNRYIDSGYSWNPQTYACAVKPGDQRWLNFVNTVLREAMMGVDFASYASSFKQWFGVVLEPPTVGFPAEFK